MASRSSQEVRSSSRPDDSGELVVKQSLTFMLALSLSLCLAAPLCALVAVILQTTTRGSGEFALVAGLAALCILGIVAVLVGVHLKIARPIRQLARSTTALVSGDFNVQILTSGTTEIGVLGRALNQMITNLRSVVEQADTVARGDYSAEIKPRSDKDALGVALFEMTQTLRDVVKVCEAVSSGDYSTEVSVKGDQDLLGQALNQMITNLRDVVEQINSAGSQMVSASREQAEGAKNQSVATEEMSSTVTELLTSAQKMAENAGSVSEQAGLAANECTNGKTSVESAVQGIKGVHERVEKIAAHMVELGGKSQQISGVLDIIIELSEQTNLLSLNASIEAAGAGEAGKRFAVVASEIRKLAERATDSTGEIRKLIDGIQETLNATIMATEEGTKAVAEGVRLTEEVNKSFEDIVEQVASTTQSAKAIEMGSRQQATAIEQMEGAVKNVDTAAQQTAETARQLDTNAQALLETARRLHRSKQKPQAV